MHTYVYTHTYQYKNQTDLHQNTHVKVVKTENTCKFTHKMPNSYRSHTNLFGFSGMASPSPLSPATFSMGSPNDSSLPPPPPVLLCCLCVCVLYIYVCMCVVYICVYVCSIHMYICVVCEYVWCIWIDIYTHIFVYVYIHIYIYIYIYMNMHIYVYMYIDAKQPRGGLLPVVVCMCVYIMVCRSGWSCWWEKSQSKWHSLLHLECHYFSLES